MSSPAQRAWQLIDTLGPLFSHSGLKNWDLCLAREAIIARPRSLWVTVKAAFGAGLGSPGTMQRAWGSSAGETGERVLQDDGDARWRRYPIGELASIVMRRSAGGANEIRLTRQGMQPDGYALGDRSQTDRCRTALGQIYPGLYREENF